MHKQFGKDFYPTPIEVIQQMIEGYDIHGKIILEPSAGKGNIVDYLKNEGAQVIACEVNDDLRKILATKCPIIEKDFLKLVPEKITHVNFIIMNPPFSADEKHILHAWDIAPPGCTILALCNSNTYGNRYTYKANAKIREMVSDYGTAFELGNCFSDSERETEVEVTLLRLQKPGNSENEFDGFFMGEDEPDNNDKAGLLPYNYVRDIVHRYITALKVYDEQLDAGVRMNNAIETFRKHEYGDILGDKLKFVVMTNEGKQVARNDFKKALQKAAWQFVISQSGLEKHSTSSLHGDINKFVENKTQIPFTMRNIYRMLDIVIQTTGQRMDKATLAAFDKVTEHYDDNRYHVEGWKTNSHYLLNEKFILPYMVASDYGGRGYMREQISSSYFTMIDDLIKSLCYVTGTKYDNSMTLRTFFHNNDTLSFGIWYECGFFQIKGFKKGSMHFKFQDKKIWEMFNRKVAELKGYPLPEAKKPTSHKEKKADEAKEAETAKRYRPDVMEEEVNNPMQVVLF